MAIRSDGSYKKATKNEKNNRVQEVLELIISGVTRFQIVDVITEKYGIGTRMADNYIRDAWSLIEQDSEKDRRRLRCLATARYTKIHNLSLSSGDLKSAISAQEKIDKLNFLNVLSEQDMAVIREDDNGAVDLSKLSDDEIETMIAIQEKARGGSVA